MPETVPDLTTPATCPTTYISIPTRITAMQWTGGNIQDLWDWITAEFLYGPIPAEPIIREHARPARLYVAANDAWLDLEVGEWIIQDALGFYPCKDSVFTAKYRAAPIEDELAALKDAMRNG
jgi:hypothetical protein